MGRKGAGIEVREKSVRLSFTPVRGHGPVKETLRDAGGNPLPPTPANQKRAATLMRQVQGYIDMGLWTPAVWRELFPHSPALAKLHAPAAPGTFGDAADLWLAAKGQKMPATLALYGTAVRFWKGLIDPAQPIRAIQHKHLAAVIGRYPWKSAKTCNNYLIALRGIFGMEYSGADAKLDPTAGIENMPVVRLPPDPFTADERDAILASIAKHNDPRMWHYWRFMFATGMRPEEAIALQWGDIDWRQQTVLVQRVRTFRGSERDGSKTHSTRTVDLIDTALDALREMKPWTFMLGMQADVFQNPHTDRPFHDERSQRDHSFMPALRRLGIRYRRAYATRHTFATLALMAGVPPAYIASQLGHSVQMLLEVYARWIPSNDNGATRTLLQQSQRRNDDDLPARKEHRS